MGGGGGSQESKTELSPEFKPYVNFSLGEAKRLYQGMPAAPETLAAPQSEASIEALRRAEERAMAGSPLLRAAQAEQMATIEGRGVNPF